MYYGMVLLVCIMSCGISYNIIVVNVHAMVIGSTMSLFTCGIFLSIIEHRKEIVLSGQSFFVAVMNVVFRILHITFLSTYDDRGPMVGTPQIGGHLAMIPLLHMPLPVCM